MLDEIEAYCDENDLDFGQDIEMMRKDAIFERFFTKTSWHHTGRYAQATDFYGIDEEAVSEAFAPLSESQLAQREIRRRAAEAARQEEELKRKEEDERGRGRRADFMAEHGFAPETVAGLMARCPHACRLAWSRKKRGSIVVYHPGPNGELRSCPLVDAMRNSSGWDGEAMPDAGMIAEFERLDGGLWKGCAAVDARLPALAALVIGSKNENALEPGCNAGFLPGDVMTTTERRMT